MCEELVPKYCSYCKDSILDNDFVCDGEGNFYHKSCFIQKNTYWDEFERYEEGDR